MNDDIQKKIKQIELRLDAIEAHLSDFEPFESSDDPDILYSKAEELVKQHDLASASLLQRRLSIGYARAARILDQLTERGVLATSKGGSVPRKVIK